MHQSIITDIAENKVATPVVTPATGQCARMPSLVYLVVVFEGALEVVDMYEELSIRGRSYTWHKRVFRDATAEFRKESHDWVICFWVENGSGRKHADPSVIEKGDVHCDVQFIHLLPGNRVKPNNGDPIDKARPNKEI
jgi:hypothetical protein